MEQTAQVAESRPEDSKNLPRQKTPLSARDRLLAALETSPRLSREDAEALDQVIQEARKASLADELPR